MAKVSEIDALENRHRFEEVCEPYGLIGGGSDSDEFLVPVEQLKQTPGLGDELFLKARDAGLGCRMSDSGLHFTIPTEPHEARSAAEVLEECLYDLRECHPERFLARRFPGSNVPVDDDRLALPMSAQFMRRVVDGSFVPDDKKPPVLDLFRSTGPYLASVESDPLVLFDAASQIASHAGGVNGSRALEALYTGEFADFPIRNIVDSSRSKDVVSRLKDLLSEAAGEGLNHVTLCNSGAEANEVALRIASQQKPGRKRILSFEGAFHGRTMWALHSTWNPAKRLRFEMDGYRAHWVKWPRWNGELPIANDSHDVSEAYFKPLGACRRQMPANADELQRREYESLLAVEEALETDDIVAILVECMQSEGGDRWATERFFCHLRALALAYDTPFIVDEVQTGFSLGGPFFWHRLYRLPQPPDLVTSAKKCQVGAVISRCAVDFPVELNVTSVVRGLAQAEMVSESEASKYEAYVKRKLEVLKDAFPNHVLDPRALGYSFAFDLPSPEEMQHFVAERLWRGYMVYGAGDRTLRFRLNTEMTRTSLDALFERLKGSLETLRSQQPLVTKAERIPDQAPSWPPAPTQIHPDYRLIEITTDTFHLVRDALITLENATYEPERQDDIDAFGRYLREPGSLCFIATRNADEQDLARVDLVGMSFAFPLRCFEHIPGPKTDPMLRTGRVIYSADICVHPDHRGRGLGAALKHKQVVTAMAMRNENGNRRYDFMTGRNRKGHTDAMESLNRRYGAWEAARLEHQYGGNGVASYYRIPLCAPHLPHIPECEEHEAVDFDPGLEQRIRHDARPGSGSGEMDRLLKSGCLNGAIANKMSLCNFVTPGVSRGMEILRATAPEGLKHLIVANGRAEAFDKALRGFKFHRPKASTVLTVGPVNAGWTTAAARSIALPSSDP